MKTLLLIIVIKHSGFLVLGTKHFVRSWYSVQETARCYRIRRSKRRYHKSVSLSRPLPVQYSSYHQTGNITFVIK
jgi:hypothetical protein